LSGPDLTSKRLAGLRDKLARKKLKALLVSGPESRRYLSGFKAADGGLTESSGHLLVTGERAFLLTDFRYGQEAAEEAPGCEVKVYRDGLPKLLAELLAGEGLDQVGLESEYLTYAAVSRLRKALKGIRLVPTSGLVEGLRLIKDETEIGLIEAALAIIEAVVDEVIGRLEEGLSESQAAWWIVEGLRARGAEPAFEPIVASGPEAAKPHARPGGRLLGREETILIDAGARLEGYCSDITRTVWLGRPSDRFREVYAAVRQAQLAALAGLKPGLKTDEADGLARRVIEAAGFGELFGHSLGHGVGLAVHEGPNLSPLRSVPLRPGMIHTVEPGVYLPGWGGVRLEVMAAITPESCRILGGLDRFYSF